MQSIRSSPDLHRVHLLWKYNWGHHLNTPCQSIHYCFYVNLVSTLSLYYKYYIHSIKTPYNHVNLIEPTTNFKTLVWAQTISFWGLGWAWLGFGACLLWQGLGLGLENNKTIYLWEKTVLLFLFQRIRTRDIKQKDYKKSLTL